MNIDRIVAFNLWAFLFVARIGQIIYHNCTIFYFVRSFFFISCGQLLLDVSMFQFFVMWWKSIMSDCMICFYG